MKKNVMSMLVLKRAYQLVSAGNKAELQDTARNNLVVFAGSFLQCVREAKRIGVWYS